MKGHRVPNRSLAQRRMNGGIGKATVRFGICAIVLLVAAGLGARIARSQLAAPGWSSAQFQGSAVGDPERGQRVAETRCAACHGKNGNSPDPQYPKLAGQNSAYLYWQLWAFKQGTRRSDVMSGIVATLSDADMANAASFYGQQRRNPDAVRDAYAASIGERFFVSGMPSCAMCHGSPGQRGMMGRMPMMGRGMMGMMGPGAAAVPNLNGQHANYIIDQLDKFASGERQGTVMNRMAPALSEANRKAVAEYLSGVP